MFGRLTGRMCGPKHNRHERPHHGGGLACLKIAVAMAAKADAVHVCLNKAVCVW